MVRIHVGLLRLVSLVILVTLAIALVVSLRRVLVHCCRELLSRSNSRASNEHGDGDGGGRGARQGGGGSAREFPRLYYISDLRSGSLGQETVGCVDIAKVALANSPSRSVLPESMLGRLRSASWYFRYGTSPKTGRSTMDAISLWRMRTPPNLCFDTLLGP